MAKHSQKRPFQALVIGAGKIGAFYDSPSSKTVLTHAAAYQSHSQFNLGGIVDVDFSKARRAARIWGTSAFDSLDKAFRVVRPDVVSVCVPTELHAAVVKKIVSLGSPFVVLEKPITSRWSESVAVAQLVKRRRLACLVNYSRRFDPVMADVKKAIVKGKWGRFISGFMTYSKGFRNNGSHVINLLQYLLGGVSSGVVTKKVFDFKKEDPSLGGTLFFSRGGDVHLIPIDERAYSHWEGQLFFEKGRIGISRFGFNLSLDSVQKDARYPGYKELARTRTIKTELDESLLEALSQISRYFSKGNPHESSIQSALETDRVVSILSHAPTLKEVSLRVS